MEDKMILEHEVNPEDYKCKVLLPDGKEGFIYVYKGHTFSIQSEDYIRWQVATHKWCGVDGHAPFLQNHYCRVCAGIKKISEWVNSESVTIKDYTGEMVYSMVFDEWLPVDQLEDFIYDDCEIQSNDDIQLWETVPVEIPLFSLEDHLCDTFGEEQILDDIDVGGSLYSPEALELLVNNWLRNIKPYSFDIGKRKVLLGPEWFASQGDLNEY